MPLRSADRTTLVLGVIDQLQEQVTSGEWPVGSRIPTEPQLVAALGVSRNTIREAVRALVHAGLLESRQGSGTYVRSATELTGAVARRIASARVAEVLEVRRALEVAAAQLAAVRRTPEDVIALDGALVTREAAWRSGDVTAFIEADAALHGAVVSAAHNGVLAELYADFGSALRASLTDAVGEELTADRYVGHSELVAAIRAGDAKRAGYEAGAFLPSTISNGRDPA
ncbi:MAG TPA: FadR/GntR family transcriptional regulator [Micromonosporaceae bacterium]|nr:FadR/GntR family transcriptional regulator [Micromonosporaceae bacterium]